MTLILNDLPPLHWAVAGALIAAITLLLLLVANRRLGLSSGLEDVCSLVLGGFLSAVTGGGWSPTWDLGRFDEVVALGPAGKTAWMFAGGLFIGFGTRLAGGCTSGHGIFGLSNFELPSLLSTLSFMAGGIVTTQIVYRVIFG